MQYSARYRNLPIKYKLRMIIMSVVTIALIFVSLATLAYDQLSLSSNMRNDLGILAEIFANHNTAALTFRDPKASTELLDGLRPKRNVLRAYVFDANGELFASYRNPSAPAIPKCLPLPPTPAGSNTAA